MFNCIVTVLSFLLVILGFPIHGAHCHHSFGFQPNRNLFVMVNNDNRVGRHYMNVPL
jgi:hypothetical protein